MVFDVTEEHAACISVSLTLKLEATCTFETSGNFFQTTWHHIQEHGNLHSYCCENLKSQFAWHNNDGNLPQVVTTPATIQAEPKTVCTFRIRILYTTILSTQFSILLFLLDVIDILFLYTPLTVVPSGDRDLTSAELTKSIIVDGFSRCSRCTEALAK
jgi:hypothetical protein